MAQKGKYTYDWPRPMVTVDAAVFSQTTGQTKILLIQRANPPFQNKWALPGGFVEMDEELHDAAARELSEETSLTEIELKQVHTVGTIGRDPRGRQITIVYAGFADDKAAPLRPGDDAAQAKWFDIDNLPDLAFDHAEIIRIAAEKTGLKKDPVQNGAEKLQQLSWGYRSAAVLQAANRLGVFEALRAGTMTAGQISENLKTEIHLTEKLLIACAAMGLVQKKQQHYSNSKLSETFLVEGEPFYQGDIIEHSSNVQKFWNNLEQNVRNGPSERSYKASEHRSFIMAMHNVAVAGRAQLFTDTIDLTGRKKMLDLGGGPGTYSIAACRKYPQLKAIVFDLPQTIAITQQLISRQQMTDKVNTVAGDWDTDDFGKDFDTVLMSNILHGPSSNARTKLVKAFGAMTPGAMLIIQEFLLSNDKTGPLIPALFNLMVGAYSKKELISLINSSGFHQAKIVADIDASGICWLTAAKTL